MSQPDLTFVIPTHRLRDVGETVQEYDRHFWKNADVHPGRARGQLGRRHEASRAQPLKIAAKIYPEERGYFDEELAPLLESSRPLVEFVGQIGNRERDELLGGAAALVFPIEWPEPFGLVMIEAMACGTPVVAWRRGSVPEVVDGGVTGITGC